MHQACGKDVEITDVGVFGSQRATKGNFSSETLPRINQILMEEGKAEFNTKESHQEKEAQT